MKCAHDNLTTTVQYKSEQNKNYVFSQPAAPRLYGNGILGWNKTACCAIITLISVYLQIQENVSITGM